MIPYFSVQVGSSLHLYRNPIDVDLENEEGEADEQEKDSLDGVEMLHEHWASPWLNIISYKPKTLMILIVHLSFLAILASNVL